MKITLNLKYHDNSIHKVEVPTSWSDLSLKQVIELNDLTTLNRIKIISILTGIHLDILSELNGKQNLETLNQIETLFQFINEAPNFNEFKLPKKITLKGKEIIIPQDLTKETYGQKVAIEELIRNSKTEVILPLIPEVLSIYLYPIFSEEKFKDERVDDFIEIMKEIQISEAYPIATFFLIRRGLFYKLSETL